MLRTLLASIILLFTVHLQSQTTEIFGRVYDARTQEPAPFVNVKFNGQLQGTSTDDKGIYRIRTTLKADSIIFSFIGYKRYAKKIRFGKYQEVNVELEEGGISLNEVTIKAGKRKRVVDTTANYVYYRVVENKSNNKVDQANTYHYNEYTKLLTSLLNEPPKFLRWRIFRPFQFLFDNIDYTEDSSKFIPGLMKESVAEVYYRKEPKEYKRTVVADILTGVDNQSLNTSTDYYMANIETYDNVFVIAGKSFQSPFAPGAIILYRYYLTDTVRAAGRTSYKLHFVSKNKEDIALKGFAWIDSATWAIKTFKFRPNEKANINFIADYTVLQNFIYLKDQWIKQSETLQAVGSLNRKKNKFALLIQKTYERKNIEIDIDLPDSVFAGKDEVVYDDSARTLARPRLDSLRFSPLTPQEKLVYVFSDSLPKMRAYKQWYYTINVLTTAMFRIPNINGPIEFGRFYKFVSKNNVEGIRLRLGMRTTKHFSESLYLEGHTAYGLKDRDVKYSGTVRIFPKTKSRKWNAFQFMYKYDMEILGQENLFVTFDNVISLLRKNSVQRILKVRQANVQWDKDWFNGFSTMMAFDKRTYYNEPGVFDFARPDKDGNMIPVPRFSTSELWVDFRYAYKEQTYVAYGYRYFQRITKYPQFNFRVTGGIKGLLEGEHNYLKLNAMMYHRLSSPAGYTRYTIKAGYMVGSIPYPTSFIYSGGLGGILYDYTTYNLMREFEFIADKYVSVWVDHHFDGFFLNKIPGIKRLQLREFITFKALIGDFSKKNNDVLMVPAGFKTLSYIPYIEAGFGIENIFKIFRVDLLFRATYLEPNTNYWKGFGSNWGIKIGYIPKF